MTLRVIPDQGAVIPDQEVAILEAANAKNAVAIARDAATDTAQAVQPRCWLTTTVQINTMSTCLQFVLPPLRGTI